MPSNDSERARWQRYYEIESERHAKVRALLREAVDFPGSSKPPGWGRRARLVLNAALPGTQEPA